MCSRPFNWSGANYVSLFYIFAFSILLVCYNEVSEILELKKRLPDVVMTVVFPGM